MPQNPGSLQADPTVREGGTIQIRVRDEVKEVLVSIPGRDRVRIPATRGRAEFQVPPGVVGGTIIFLSDGQYPAPSGAAVQVVGGGPP